MRPVLQEDRLLSVPPIVTHNGPRGHFYCNQCSSIVLSLIIALIFRMKQYSEDFQRRLAAEREKERMRALNSAFDQLRRKLKKKNRKKLTKIKTLRLAIEYIQELRQFLHRNEYEVKYDLGQAEIDAVFTVEKVNSNVGTMYDYIKANNFQDFYGCGQPSNSCRINYRL